MKTIQNTVVKTLFTMIISVFVMAEFVFANTEFNQAEKNFNKTEKVRGKVYEQVEQMPVYPGGEAALRDFMATSIRYPREAKENGIQGKVFVNFVVDRKGYVREAKIAKGVNPLLDAEALRVVNDFPQWTPGKEKGRKVAVQYTIPINFRLQ